MKAPALASVERRRPRAAAPGRGELLTFARALREGLVEELSRAARVTFPSARYREDPVGFAREVLGVEPWSKQIEILELVRDHRRVAVKSGHRVGKSHTIAILALWYYCSFEDARVVLSSTTSRQVDTILWREVKKLRARSGRCIACKAGEPGGAGPCPHSAPIDGEMGELARTGLKSQFREILGYTARESEAIAGVAGSQLLFMLDEASGVPEFIFEALAGNRAGGARLVLFGNPTRNAGEFYDAFHKKAAFYRTLTVSSEESPNAIAGRTVVPGLAEREWIDEVAREYGADSAFYKIRVKGEHAEQEEGRLFSIHRIAEAQARWHETPEAGRLYVGLDPAGPGGSGDESCYAPRRGLRCLGLVTRRGLTEEAHVVELLGLLAKYRLPRETPVVVLDREGSVGAAVYGHLRSYVDRNRGAFELVPLRASDRAHRQPHIYDRMRDELVANLDAWMRDGGAIPEDALLEKELHALEWEHSAARGLMKITAKVELRKKLGRSPDRLDALALSAWEPLSLRDGAPVGLASGEGTPASSPYSDERVPAMDPYAGVAPWGRR